MYEDEHSRKEVFLDKFCRQLINQSQWKRARHFYCGSSMEIPVSVHVANWCGIRNTQLDQDQMVYDTSRYAFAQNVSVPETFNGSIIRIYSEEAGLHVGYVRLIHERNNHERNNLEPQRDISHKCKEGDNERMHGPAVLHNAKRIRQMESYALSDVAFDYNHLETKDIYSYDVTVAIHSPYWPVEATEWITRRRSQGVPSMSVIKKVIRYGCDFVQVSHKLSDNRNEWRFSFSKAEHLIIQGWSASQKIVYDTLWAMNKKVDSQLVCTYYFKTLMFWACEEKPAQFWQDDLLVFSVRELLIEMINCLTLKFCANYFIPGNNMMDHLIDIDLTRECQDLWIGANSTDFITNATTIFRNYESIFVSGRRYYESPCWIKRALLIHQRLDCILDNFTNLFNTSYSSIDLQQAVYVEISDVFKGLSYQTQASNPDLDHFMRRISLMKCEHHLTRAVKLCESQDRDIIQDCSEEFLHSIGWFISYDPDQSSIPSRQNLIEQIGIKRTTTEISPTLTSEIERTKHKCLLYSRSSDTVENKGTLHSGENDETYKYPQIRTVLYRVHSKVSPESMVQFYKEWPGRSPTVNISWFSAKAYLANLYYITQRDVSLIIKTCDDIIDVYKLSFVNREFAERTFPVILSTQWTSIYDNEIQELLGFYFLSSYAINKSNSCAEMSVHLGVCPVQFALYLKVRTSTQHNKDYCECTTINKYVNDYICHNKSCECDSRVNNGGLAVTLIMCANVNRYFLD